MTTGPVSPQQPPGAPTVAPRMDIGDYLSKAWRLVTGNFVLLVVGYLVVGLIIGVSCLVIVGPFIIGGPLMFGYMRVVQKRYKGEEATFGDLFACFKQDFTKGLVTGLIMAGVMIVSIIAQMILGLVPVIGFLAGMAASLVIGAATFFLFGIAALSDVPPGQALSRSINFCKANFWPTVLLSVVVNLIMGVGVIACCIGVFFTVPLGITASIIAYNEYYLPNSQNLA